MNVITICPPLLLVRMFGVPDAVAMPAKIGDEITFKAHGQEWYCKRLPNSYFLAAFVDGKPHGRARFGTAKQIAKDIGAILETGALPREKTSFA